MKKVGFLIFCLFAMCSMAGKAQDVVADSTGYIVKVGEMAPDFTVKLTDGKALPFRNFVGRWSCCSLPQAGVECAVRRCLSLRRIYG